MLTLADIEAASKAVYGAAIVTPVLESYALSQRAGAAVHLKAECLQHTGSFKVRGAGARISRLAPQERAQGVVTASAGNHAQGVAVAAAAAGVSATVVMPANAALAKVQATRAYGARVILKGAGFSEATDEASRIAAAEGRIMIPAFDDEAIIAGQGSLGLEIARQCPDAKLVLVPVGGGGLIAGIAVALKALLPGVTVVGVQAEASPGAARSLSAGGRLAVTPAPTLADGVAVAGPGALTFPLIQRYVDDIVTVDEEDIAQAIVLLLERSKLVVEGAGALGAAALMSGTVKAEGRETVVVLSGGNIDINLLASVVQHGLLGAGRYFTLTVGIEDTPGKLAALLKTVADEGANVLEVSHLRQGVHMPLRGVVVRLLVETRDHAHIEELASALKTAGYAETVVDATSRSYRPANWGDGQA
ncbi:MAG TPA: threonine ammonia-lyase [Dehalococcoidia bacterium]